MTTTNSNTVTKLNKLYDFIEAWEATYAEKFGVDVSQLGVAPVNSTPELRALFLAAAVVVSHKYKDGSLKKAYLWDMSRDVWEVACDVLSKNRLDDCIDLLGLYVHCIPYCITLATAGHPDYRDKSPVIDNEKALQYGDTLVSDFIAFKE